MNLNIENKPLNKDVNYLKVPSINSLYNALNKYYSNLEKFKLNNTIESYTLDRIEGDIAIIENRSTQKINDIKKCDLPKEIKEGSIIKFSNGVYVEDKNLTYKIKNDIEKMFNNL